VYGLFAGAAGKAGLMFPVIGSRHIQAFNVVPEVGKVTLKIAPALRVF
jgi:hypothetical protein